MADKRTVYCDISFWKKFVMDKPNMEDLNDRNIKQMQCWLNFLKFLSRSNLQFNIGKEDYNNAKASDSLLASLWKKSCNGECGIDFVIDDFPSIDKLSVEKIDDNLLNSICLVDEDDLCCSQKYASYGIMAINPKQSHYCYHLFADNGIAVPHKQEKDWSFLDRISRTAPSINCGNSIIIVDNYMMQNWDRACDSNIIPILERLLPYSLAKGLVYNISIFTMVDGNAELCKQLKDKITQIRSGLVFNLNVINVATKKQRPDGSSYCSSKYFHDRAIITNYLWIGSGHGFDVFPFTEGGKSTTINVIFPYFQPNINWVDKAYENLIDDAKKINSKYLTYTIDYWGDKKRMNHILKEYIFKKDETKEELIAEKGSEVIFNLNTSVLPGLKVLGTIDLSKIPQSRTRVRF